MAASVHEQAVLATLETALEDAEGIDGCFALIDNLAQRRLGALPAPESSTPSLRRPLRLRLAISVAAGASGGLAAGAASAMHRCAARCGAPPFRSRAPPMGMYRADPPPGASEGGGSSPTLLLVAMLRL